MRTNRFNFVEMCQCEFFKMSKLKTHTHLFVVVSSKPNKFAEFVSHQIRCKKKNKQQILHFCFGLSELIFEKWQHILYTVRNHLSVRTLASKDEKTTTTTICTC